MEERDQLERDIFSDHKQIPEVLRLLLVKETKPEATNKSNPSNTHLQNQAVLKIKPNLGGRCDMNIEPWAKQEVDMVVHML